MADIAWIWVEVVILSSSGREVSRVELLGVVGASGLPRLVRCALELLLVKVVLLFLDKPCFRVLLNW